MIEKRIFTAAAAVFLAAAHPGCSCEEGGNGNGDADTGIDPPVEDVAAEDVRPEDVRIDDVLIDDVLAEDPSPFDVPADPVPEDPPIEDAGEEEEQPGSYTCVPNTACRNGSEECDDQAFTVPSEGDLVLVCIDGNHGIAFISSSTGPSCTDEESCSGTDGNDRPRCQGYEKCLCVHFWEHEDYGNVLYSLECTEPDLMLPVDLTPGEHLWVGTHDNPAGGGHMNEVCLGVRN